jgi:hypothetical protein
MARRSDPALPTEKGNFFSALGCDPADDGTSLLGSPVSAMLKAVETETAPLEAEGDEPPSAGVPEGNRSFRAIDGDAEATQEETTDERRFGAGQPGAEGSAEHHISEFLAKIGIPSHSPTFDVFRQSAKGRHSSRLKSRLSAISKTQEMRLKNG